MTTPFDNVELAMAFQNWAIPRGYDMTHNGERFLNLETNAAWLGFEAAHGEHGMRPAGQQLYALIKKSSKYAHQTDKLFKVRVGKAPYDNFVVHGGPGSLYALRDVHFYVLVDGKPMRLA